MDIPSYARSTHSFLKSYVGFVSTLFGTVKSLLHKESCHLCRHSMMVVGNLSHFEMEWDLWNSGAGSLRYILPSTGNEPTQLDSCCSDACRNLWSSWLVHFTWLLDCRWYPEVMYSQLLSSVLSRGGLVVIKIIIFANISEILKYN